MRHLSNLPSAFTRRRPYKGYCSLNLSHSLFLELAVARVAPARQELSWQGRKAEAAAPSSHRLTLLDSLAVTAEGDGAIPKDVA